MTQVLRCESVSSQRYQGTVGRRNGKNSEGSKCNEIRETAITTTIKNYDISMTSEFRSQIRAQNNEMAKRLLHD